MQDAQHLVAIRVEYHEPEPRRLAHLSLRLQWEPIRIVSTLPDELRQFPQLHQTERTLRCKYCNVDVFLPDAVWLKLHPAKVAKF